MRTTRDLILRVAVLVLFAAAVVLPFLVTTYHTQLATKVMLLGIVAMGLNLVVGFGGLVSLCHAAFYGLAGYALALTAPKYEAASVFLTLPVALLASSAAALAIGALSLRTRGIYFIMVTLAFGEMLFYLFHDTHFAGGSDGTFINLRPAATIFGFTLVDLDNQRVFYWLILALTVGTVAFLSMLTRSPFGRALAAARDNERRARALGFTVYRLRLMAFVVSGAIAGLGGYFAAAQFGFVAPQMLGWHLSASLLVMVVLGGMRTVTGPLIGAIIIIGLEEWLQILTEHWKLAMGLIVIALVLAVPGGVKELMDRAFPKIEPVKDKTAGQAAVSKLAPGHDHG